jgi:hypothetical protein
MVAGEGTLIFDRPEMPLDIRYAGLEADVERRVQFAVNGLAAHKIDARARPWDGTRCDMLVTDADDTYGRVAIDRARRRDTTILAFTNHLPRTETWALWLRRDSTVSNLTRAIADATVPLATAAAAPAAILATPTAKDVRTRSGLVHLATKQGMSAANAVLTLRDKKLLAHCDSGRLYATSHADILMASELLAGYEWTFESTSGNSVSSDMRHSTSLDSIYVQTALRRRDNLPAFPLKDIWLCDWPDLGQIPECVNALHIVNVMLRGKTDAEKISLVTGAPMDQVNACLWAFAASGLLQHASVISRLDPLQQVSVKSRFTSIVGRLARHFGLREQRL